MEENEIAKSFKYMQNGQAKEIDIGADSKNITITDTNFTLDDYINTYLCWQDAPAS